MSHIESNVISRASDAELVHLESCERCRKRVATDVDLGSVRDQLLSEATTEPRSVTLHPRQSWSPWLVGVGAAALVGALFVPVLLLNSQPGSDSASAPTTAPALPPDFAEQPDPPTPPTGSDATSFEMTFQGEDGIVGRLIWASPTFYEGLRITAGSNGATYDYGFFREESFGYDEGAIDPFPKTEDGQIGIGALPEDPAVPWTILIDPPSTEVMWSTIGGTGQPVSIEPTHPLAVSAFAAEEVRLEVNEDGIPVLVASPSIGVWQATSFQHRSIRAGEVGNNIDIPVNYALYLAETTSDEQRGVIGDGMVTLADYQTAATRTAECAGVEAVFDQDTGLYTFNASDQLEECRTQHLDDIEEIWRVDSQFIESDELVIIAYTTEGRPELADMYKAEPGSELPLASGPGWAVSIWERGDGLCTRASVGASLSEGCNLRSLWQIPEVLDVSVGTVYDGESNLIGAEITGLVAADVTRVVVTFDSGDTIDITPGETTQFGVKGFGLASIDATGLGEPTTIEVFANDQSLGVYDHSTGRPAG